MSDTPNDVGRGTVRVVLDATGLGTLDSLVDEYVVELARAAGRTSRDVVVVCRPRDAKLFKSFDLEVHRAPDRVLSERQRRWWVSWGLPRLASELGAQVIHSPHDVFPTSSRVRRVVAVHNPIGSPPRIAVRRATSRRIDVIAPTEAVAADVRAATGAPSNRVHVGQRGVDKSRSRIPDWDALTAFEDTYGTTEWVAVAASLNTLDALSAFCDGFRQATEFGDRRPTVFITGIDESVAVSRTRGLIDAAFDVRIIGTVPDDERSALFGGAVFAFIADDSNRTGRTLVTAMMSGATIITLHEPVFTEMGGTAVEYVEPSAASMEIAITGLLNNSDRRQVLATSAVTAANAFTWDACLDAHFEAWTRARSRT